MILRLLCIWLVFYSMLSSLILSNLKHELLNRLRSTMAANVLTFREPSILIYSYNESQGDALFLKCMWWNTLHVSDRSTVHHQDYLNNIYTAIGICHTSSVGCLLADVNRTYLLSYSMEQSPSWEANWSAASQEIPRILWNPKVHHRTHKRTPPVPILS
jgi:hypothetical protein